MFQLTTIVSLIVSLAKLFDDSAPTKPATCISSTILVGAFDESYIGSIEEMIYKYRITNIYSTLNYNSCHFANTFAIFLLIQSLVLKYFDINTKHIYYNAENNTIDIEYLMYFYYLNIILSVGLHLLRLKLAFISLSSLIAWTIILIIKIVYLFIDILFCMYKSLLLF